VSHVKHRLVAWTRRSLQHSALRWRAARRVLEIAEREAGRALEHPLYDRGYYDGASQGREGGVHSGYDDYTLESSHAPFAAYLAWRWFAPGRSLDVGCAVGYVVAVERGLGIEARGVDVSRWAVEHPAPGAEGRLEFANLAARLPFDDGEFDLVTAFETFEHVAPADVPHAIAEVARVSGAWVLATIPSFGANPSGPGGWLNGKVRWDRLEHYDALGDSYDGPLPEGDLMRDSEGRPVEGHLTIASFRWWSERFAEAGLRRVPELERAINRDVARFGLTEYWNVYALAKVGAAHDDPATLPGGPHLRSDDEIAAVEARLGISECEPRAVDLARIEAAERDGEGAAVRTTGPFRTKAPGPADLDAARRAGVTLPA
jgi:2-polyprenyl-3-methyl-5-hydroxy-6-metoxy-1,4-benzoquinol methylase